MSHAFGCMQGFARWKRQKITNGGTEKIHRKVDISGKCMKEKHSTLHGERGSPASQKKREGTEVTHAKQKT